MFEYSWGFARFARVMPVLLAVPVLSLVAAPATAAPAQSAMCADINATYASVSIMVSQSGPSRNYTNAEYQLGDVITIEVSAVPATGGAANVNVGGGGYPGDPDAITPSFIGLQNIGVASATVTNANGPNISISSVVGSAAPSGVPMTFSITCTSAAPQSPAASAPPLDTIVNLVQQTHTALVARSVGTPGLQQRLGMVSGNRPGSATLTPGEASGQLNFATSLVELQAWGAAGDAAAGIANADPLDQPFNFWIDGSGSLHARTSAGTDYWGSFGLVSAGADYLVSRQLLIGVALHGDFMRDISASTTVNGKGLMAGPYVSAEVADGVYLDAAAYYGKSWNDVASGLFAGTFDTQRFVGSGQLSGDVDLGGDVTLTPNVSLFYLRETAGAYTLSDGAGGTVAGSGFDNSQLRVAAGGQLAYEMDLGDGSTLTPMVGANLGLAFSDGGQHLFGTALSGLTYQSGSNASLGAQIEAAADNTSFRSLTARATARLSF